ncbi:zinc ABC transporter substrate binding protein ZnuA [Moraxella bovoculi 237]|uniref:High-affinity zinc uptake system protein ZnuA n=1 Tax=Moraxella bovoculi 237 TaxID=743974 RepID=A0A066UKY7_9GAMM|nr:metal ABC transporter substrate-binding protein [Moraxella bovoculi]KDN24883.1 zinc ABC transporter substrate binding protein ZnuA [Moraxella bovoculi 237]
MSFNSIIKNITKTTIAVSLLAAGTAHAGVVSVSNYPLALLSNAVTKDAAPAKVLLNAGDVGHHGELSPSAKKLVVDSDYVVWFGGALEQNLVNTLSDAPNAISLFDFNAFERLPLRNIDGTAQPGSFDAHIWLEPENAKAIVRALAVVHSHANPEHKEKYAQNAVDFQARMDDAVAKVNLSAKSLPYWAYHDAFQYLERSANLKFAGALTPDHHLSPKVSQIRLLSQSRPQAGMCIASQGRVSDGIVNKLGNVGTVVRQEDMSDGTDFIDAWQELALTIRDCASSNAKQ